MSYYEFRDASGLLTGDVRICYVRAWDDAQWCERNGIPSPTERRKVQRDRRRAEKAARASA